MLTLARFVLEKVGGDTVADAAANLATYKARIAEPLDAPVAGGARRRRAARWTGRGAPRTDRLGRGRLRRRRLGRAMDIVLVGLPGSGKSVVGKRLARRHGATFIDLDERDRAEDGRPIPTIFAEDGEAAFRAIERARRRGPRPGRSRAPASSASIATGGGAVVDPRNRWALYRGRIGVWLDGRPRCSRSDCADRRTSGRSSPAVTRSATIRELAAKRERFYAAADIHIAGVAEVATVVDRGRERIARSGRARPNRARRCCRRRRRSGGSSSATGSPRRRSCSARRLEARRAILVSEPGAWTAVGAGLAAGLEARGLGGRAPCCCPEGEAAKRLAVDRDRRQ